MSVSSLEITKLEFSQKDLYEAGKFFPKGLNIDWEYETHLHSFLTKNRESIFITDDLFYKGYELLVKYLVHNHENTQYIIHKRFPIIKFFTKEDFDDSDYVILPPFPYLDNSDKISIGVRNINTKIKLSYYIPEPTINRTYYLLSAKLVDKNKINRDRLFG